MRKLAALFFLCMFVVCVMTGCAASSGDAPASGDLTAQGGVVSRFMRKLVCSL